MTEFGIKEAIKTGFTIVGTGAFTLLLGAFLGRNKDKAETSKLKAETVLTFADGWQSLAKEYKDGMEKSNSLVESMRKQIIDLTELIETERAERAQEKAQETVARETALKEKDAQILKITTRVRTLEDILKKNGIASPEEFDIINPTP